MKLSSLFRLIAASIVGILSVTAGAASPGSGSLDGQRGEATWTGGPFVAPNPSTTGGLVKQVPCDVGQPVCDSFRLTVASNVSEVLIAIAPGAGFETDDYDLYVYNDQGVQIASDASEDGYEAVVIANSGSTYSGVAQPTRRQPVDSIRECLEAVPDQVMVPVLDSGQMIDLTVMLL